MLYEVITQELKGYERLPAEIEGAEAAVRKHQGPRDLFVANQEQAGKLEERQAELEKFEKLLVQLQQELAGKEHEFKVAIV